MALLNLSLTRLIGSSRTAQTQCDVVRLSGRSTQSVPADGQTLNVLSGCAWVSLDGKDLIVPNGHSLTLATSSDAAVISALGGQPLVCELL